MSKLSERPIDKIILEVEKFRPFDIDTKGVKELVVDIRKNGLLVPLTVWKREKRPHEYVLISGHHRLEALKKLKYEKVPCNIVEFSSEDEAIIASYAMNSQDEYSSNNRNWYDRLNIAETVLRPVVVRHLKTKKGGKGKKTEKKERADKILSKKCGLNWNYKKYSEMRKVNLWLKKNELAWVVLCIKLDQSFSVRTWFDLVQRLEKGEFGDNEEDLLQKKAEKIYKSDDKDNKYLITDVVRELCKKKNKVKEEREVENPVSEIEEENVFDDFEGGEIQLMCCVMNEDELGEEICDIVLKLLKKDKRLKVEHGAIDWNEGQKNIQKIIVRKK